MKESTDEPATVMCVIRHGDAGAHAALPHRDRLRPLTDKGKRQSKRAGRVLARLGLSPQEIWSSKLVRAVETAGIAAKAADSLGARIETSDLAPDAAPERIVTARWGARPAAPRAKARKGRSAKVPVTDVLWVVGHEPHLSLLIGHVTGAPPRAIRLGKGAVAVVEFPGRVAADAGRMTLLLPPAALKGLD